MLELREWWSTSGLPDKPWLVLGKGPTFGELGTIDRSAYNLLSLNHVVEEVSVDVAHVIDVDVVAACAESLPRHCRWLLMPRFPHVRSRMALCALEQFFDAVPVLRELDDAGRLIWYNAATGPDVAGSPRIAVSTFSAEAAIDLLGQLGVRTIRSLGVDGGRQYSASFDHLRGDTLLANGQPSFDSQFQRVEESVARTGADYRPLVDPLRIFIGATPDELIPAKVLEHSIQRHSSVPVRVQPLHRVELPVPADRRNRGRTPFSFARFVIPALTGFRGRAVYLDADMLVFDDVAELSALPFGEAAVLCTNQVDVPSHVAKAGFRSGRQMSVLVLDCERLRWDLDEIVSELDGGRLTYEELMFDLAIEPPSRVADTVPAAWNHLEHHDPGRTKLLHYTVMPTQPWRNDANELRHLWEDELRMAVASGAVGYQELVAAARRLNVKRSLLQRIAQPRSAPAASGQCTIDAVALEAARTRIDELEGRRPAARLRRRSSSILTALDGHLPVDVHRVRAVLGRLASRS